MKEDQVRQELYYKCMAVIYSIRNKLCPLRAFAA